MKILRIVSSGFAEGGAEIGILHMQPVLEKRGHEIKILASDARPDLPHFNDYSFKAPGAGFGRLMHSFNFSAFFTLKKVLREFRPDVVHLHTLGKASPSVLFALRHYPVIATVHGPEIYTRDLILWNLAKTDFKNGEYNLRELTFIGKLRYWYYRYINYPLYRLGFKNVTTIVTISSYIKKVMLAQGMSSSYIPNGIKMLNFVPLTKSSLTHNIVFTGRLEKFKGVEYVLHALPDIIAKFPDTHFLIAGTGRDAEDLKQMTTELHLDSYVTFLGFVDGVEKKQVLIEGAAVMVVPSTWPEIFSRAGVESLSVGRPVVGSDVGGIADWLVPGVSGYLVPPANPGAIAEAVIKLFNDPDRLVQMSHSSRTKAEEFAIDIHATQIESVYKQAIIKHKKGKVG